MLKLHKYKYWFTWGIPLTLLAASSLFFWGGPQAYSLPVFRAIWNLGHLVFFGLLATWIRTTPLTKQYTSSIIAGVTANFGVLVIGLGIEWLQSQFGRDASWHDMWRNQLGFSLAWVFWGERNTIQKFALTFLAAFTFVEVGLVANTSIEDWETQHSLPVIALLEDPKELDRWHGDLGFSSQISALGKYSLQVKLSSDTKYPGAELNQMPRNWNGYEWLTFEVYNPDATPLLLVTRINDIHHNQAFSDRFNKVIPVHSGWNSVRISMSEIRESPDNREMDLQEMAKIVLFASDLMEPREFYLDHFRLE